jgi:hypothetical protein
VFRITDKLPTISFREIDILYVPNRASFVSLDSSIGSEGA